MTKRVFQRDESAVRLSEQDDAVEAEVRAERIGLVRPGRVADPVEPLRPGRATIPAVVEEDEPVMRGQRIDPGPEIGVIEAETAVHQHQRASLAGNLVIELGPVDPREHDEHLQREIRLIAAIDPSTRRPSWSAIGTAQDRREGLCRQEVGPGH